jgi:hypothetical protein
VNEAPAKKWKVGDLVRFAHVPERLARSYQIEAVTPAGAVKISGLRGEYGPHLFVEVFQAERRKGR